MPESCQLVQLRIAQPWAIFSQQCDIGHVVYTIDKALKSANPYTQHVIR